MWYRDIRGIKVTCWSTIALHRWKQFAECRVEYLSYLQFNLEKLFFYSFLCWIFFFSFTISSHLNFYPLFYLVFFFHVDLFSPGSRSQINSTNSNKHVFDVSLIIFLFATQSVSLRICLRCRHQERSFLFFNGVLSTEDNLETPLHTFVTPYEVLKSRIYSFFIGRLIKNH